ncbi:MAG: NAD-dependent epimerase/dehydratase family protein [Thermoanaerobaculia bacterium]
MRLFLTGGTGYIGRALALRLVAEGHKVRALVRPTSNAQLLQDMGVATFVGDIRERASMREGMSGADWVVHAAAELDLNRPGEQMSAANVAGSSVLSGYKLGVGRFLSISSMATFGGSPADGSPATEESPPYLPWPTRYSATKAAGEEAIRAGRSRGCGSTPSSRRWSTVRRARRRGRTPSSGRSCSDAFRRSSSRRRRSAGSSSTTWSTASCGSSSALRRGAAT